MRPPVRHFWSTGFLTGNWGITSSSKKEYSLMPQRLAPLTSSAVFNIHLSDLLGRPRLLGDQQLISITPPGSHLIYPRYSYIVCASITLYLGLIGLHNSQSSS